MSDNSNPKGGVRRIPPNQHQFTSNALGIKIAWIDENSFRPEIDVTISQQAAKVLPVSAVIVGQGGTRTATLLPGDIAKD
jgi:hypothetical protein